MFAGFSNLEEFQPRRD